MLFLLVIYIRAGKGQFPVGNTWAVTSMVMYWHFVDVVWILIFTIVYLIPH